MTWLSGWGLAACLVADVPPDVYADASHYAAPADAAVEPVDADAADDAGDPARPENDAGGGASTEPDAGAQPPNPSCDMSGRWLITERLVATGLGIQQATLWWLYLDVEQHGDALRVRKGLVCGTAANRVGSLGVDIDMHASWPAMQSKNDLSGRTGVASASAGRCELTWNRAYRVLGASTPFYLDPKRALPTHEQRASGSATGWEDWDNDGEPGVSIHISGVLNGTRYSASRLWTSYTGTISQGARAFRLSLDWNQEESVLGVTTDALKAAGVKDANKSLHFAQFARLSEQDASGSDSEICAAVRKLAPELTADAY